MKYAVAGIAVTMGLAGFAAITLQNSYYPVVEGDFEASIIETRGSVTIQASQSWRIELEDGRQWWVGVPTAAVASDGDTAKVRVFCKTTAFANCTAMYLGKTR